MLLSLFGCTTSQKLLEFSTSSLIFGSGGGISGATNEYILHYDGSIEKVNSLTNETVQVTTVSKKKSRILYQTFLNEGLDTLSFSIPGNMSYFIGYRNDTLIHKIIWGGDTNPPENAKKMYDKLIHIINNQ